MVTEWTQQPNTQTDFDSITTDALLELADENSNIILFNTGIFVDAKTEWIEDTNF